MNFIAPTVINETDLAPLLTTGQVLDDLIYGSSLFTEAEKKVEEYMGRQLLPKKTLRQRRLDVAAQCHDTPYTMGVAV